MDENLRRAIKRSIRRRATDRVVREKREPSPEWTGTGLCAGAQADGVPCHVVGRACDECGRAAAR